MIKLLNPLPNFIYVACSGGVDSMVALDFFRRSRGPEGVAAIFYHHGTQAETAALYMLRHYTDKYGITLLDDRLTNPKPADLSLEEHWRNERYAFIDQVLNAQSRDPDAKCVTAHTLDDCVETYIWSALHGTPKVIPYTRGENVVRPFLTTRKCDLYRWAHRHDVPYHEDPSNKDLRHMRNYVRHELMPHALQVNPGLYKTVKKIVEHQNTVHLLTDVQ